MTVNGLMKGKCAWEERKEVGNRGRKQDDAEVEIKVEVISKWLSAVS